MKPGDLIAVARLLIEGSNGKPSQAALRRAVSTTYYALFHLLAQTGADLFVGGPGAKRSDQAWRQVYRALEHGKAKNACKNEEMLCKFPKVIEDFGNMFVTMQEKRHLADYDPHATFSKSSVLTDIAATAKVIGDFSKAPIKDRRAFAAYVLFKTSWP